MALDNLPRRSFAAGMVLIIIATLALSQTLSNRKADAVGAPAVVEVVAPVADEPAPTSARSIQSMRFAADDEPRSRKDDSQEGDVEDPVLTVEPFIPQRDLPPVPMSAALPSQRLLIPVAGVAAADLQDSFGQARGSSRRHLAIDIPAPTGTPVVAAVDGKVIRKHHSAKGGITLYITGPDGRFIYYYAHLSTYADGLQEGDRVEQGQVVGYVGHSGNADPSLPHLHFAIWQRRVGGSHWGGVPVNPYLALTQP
jgi:peptidoglycan LD-endopeptidase LytH